MMTFHRRLDVQDNGWSIERQTPSGAAHKPSGSEWMATCFSHLFSRSVPLSLSWATGVFLFVLLAMPLQAQANTMANTVNEWAVKASHTLIGKGQAILEAGDHAKARRLFEEAIVANPANPEARTGLGFAWQLAGNLKNARKYYAIALEIDPSDTAAILHLARLDLLEGNRTAAELALRKLEQSCATCGETQELKQLFETPADASDNPEAPSPSSFLRPSNP